MKGDRTSLSGAKERRCRSCGEWFVLFAARTRDCPDCQSVGVPEVEDCVSRMERPIGARLIAAYTDA
jgi:hypothetical protein